MIRNSNTFSWERIFLVLFILLNPDVSVSRSGQAWFQQTVFLVYNSAGLIRTPTHVHTHTFSCVTQGDLGMWRLLNGSLARRLVGDGVRRGVTWAKQEAWLITAWWGRGWQGGVTWAKQEAWLITAWWGRGWQGGVTWAKQEAWLITAWWGRGWEEVWPEPSRRPL